MKSFKGFRLDTANHLLWHNGDRVPITPKGFDVLAYLVEHAGRVVPQAEILEALWPETYVNPEVLRKYILEIRKTVDDRPDNPQFIETVPKRGYRFIAPVINESTAESLDRFRSPATPVFSTEEKVEHETAISKQQTSSGRRGPWRLTVTLALAGIVGVGGYFRLARTGPSVRSLHDRSIAVLPFADMSPARDQEYFSDGLSEQLINDLAKVSGLKVVGRSSAFQFKGKNEDLREVARKLGVANVLEGSVRREGNHVRITAALIKADDGFQLWSQTYDREISDIFTVQDEIALAATTTLQLRLLGSNGQPVASTQRSANPEAYQAYLQATYFIGRGQTKEDFSQGLAYTDTAIKLDEKYAPAWALRSSVESMMVDDGLLDVVEGFQRARHDAQRAIVLDPTSPSAYLALARTQIDYDWDWDAANTSVTKAAALEPGSTDALRIHSHLSLVLGNLDDAIKLEEQAVALDPLVTNSHLGLGSLSYMAGRYNNARAEVQRALNLNPQAAFAHLLLGKILIAEGKRQEALVETEVEPVEWARLTGQVLVYHALGRGQDSNAALAKLVKKYDIDSAYQIAQVYAYRGESDKSFEWLERAYKQRDAGLTEIKADPLFNSLRHDPRYTALLKKMRLPTLSSAASGE